MNMEKVRAIWSKKKGVYVTFDATARTDDFLTYFEEEELDAMIRRMRTVYLSFDDLVQTAKRFARTDQVFGNGQAWYVSDFIRPTMQEALRKKEVSVDPKRYTIRTVTRS